MNCEGKDDLSWRERRALRRAERAHGMDRETRERTNSLIKSLDLPTGRTPTPTEAELAERLAVWRGRREEYGSEEES